MSATQHHIGLGPEHLAGNDGLGRYVLLPGDRARAARIAEAFDDLAVVDNPRGHTAHLGRLPPGIDVMAISTGMGCPSVEIVLHELLACGGRRFLRVGSCGSLVPEIAPGQVVIATAAVRDERTSEHYVPLEYPAAASPCAVQALIEGARMEGLADEVFLGITHSKDSLYAREFGHGPAADRNARYQEWLARAGVVASEMEASTLFVMASAASAGSVAPVSAAVPADVQAGCVLAVFGTHRSNMELDPGARELAEERAIRVGLAGVRAWEQARRRA